MPLDMVTRKRRGNAYLLGKESFVNFSSADVVAGGVGSHLEIDIGSFVIAQKWDTTRQWWLV